MTYSTSWSRCSLSALISLVLAVGCYGADVERRAGEEVSPPNLEAPSGSAGAGEEGGDPVDSDDPPPVADGSAGGSGGTGAEAPVSVAVDALPALYAKAECAAVARCFRQHGEIFGDWDCLGYTEGFYEDQLPRWERAVADGKANYDGTAVERCLSEKSLASCADLLDRDSEACDAVLDGTTPLGGACSDQIECSGSAFCQFTGDQCPGSCQSRKAQGGLCMEDSECESGLVCVAQSYCDFPGDIGDPCLGGAPRCAPGLWCQDASDSAPGECWSYEVVFSRDLYEDCDPFRDLLCKPGLVCALYDAENAQCEEPVWSNQDYCSAGVGSLCPQNEYCSRPDGDLLGHCTEKPGEGEPCASVTAQSEAVICADGLVCDGGTCRPWAHLGEPCVTSDVCFSGRCESNVCVSSCD